MAEGIFTKEQEKKISQLLDNVIQLKGIAEFLDGYLFKAILSFVDDKFFDKLPDELKVDLSELVDAVLAENVDLTEELAADIIDGLVDIPGLDDQSEGLLFRGALEFIIGAILDWVETKRAIDGTDVEELETDFEEEAPALRIN